MMISLYNDTTQLIIGICILFSLFRSKIQNEDWISTMSHLLLYILGGYLWPIFTFYLFFSIFLPHPYFTLY
jgi:hypothetical protein